MGVDGHGDKMENPLRGAVLCCTSILPEQRAAISEIAKQLGAEHKLDLTSDVTHLIVGSVDTPKYKYVAREREDVKVLRPEWVEAVRQAWMNAEEVDLRALENEYKFPILSGLAICLTGFDDLSFRAQLAEQISLNGGEYRGDLTKSVTHLIAYSSEGKKYQYAQQWGIKIVSLKWFKDSLDRGMVLDEADYHPTVPVDQQGLQAWNKEAKFKQPNLKRFREEDVSVEPPRKLRRSASARIGSQTESLWEDIIGKRDNIRENLRPSRSMSTVRPVILESKSFVTETSDVDSKGDVEQRKDTTVPQGFLHDTVFFLHGFNSQQTSILQKHLLAHNASIVESEWDLSRFDITSNFVLVPYDCPRSDVPQPESFDCPVQIVTNLWLEKCLMKKELIEPGNHALDAPIHTFPIPGFEKLKINSTAFEGIERLHVSKVIKTLGAIYDEYFRPEVSILVSNTQRPSEERLRHAAEWEIPVVNADWLWSCIRSGKLQPWKTYAIALPIGGRNLTRMQKAESNQVEDIKAREDAPKKALQHERPGSDFAESKAKRQSSRSNGNSSKPGPPRQFSQKGEHSSSKEVYQEVHPDKPLKEISPNSPPKRSVSPDKQKATSGFDGAASSNEKALPAQTGTQAASINDALEHLLNQQRAKSVSNSMSTKEDNAPKKKRLLGRALSNMSNSSRDSSKMRPSRASSIDSMNTDGLGSVIGDECRAASESQQPATGANRCLYSSFTGRASAKASLHSLHLERSTDLDDQHHTVNEDLAEQPQLTQLGYANPDDAVMLRELIVDKGMKKSEIDDRKDRRIRDEVGSGWGQGTKRTRTRTRDVQEVDEDDLL